MGRTIGYFSEFYQSLREGQLPMTTKPEHCGQETAVMIEDKLEIRDQSKTRANGSAE
ncbi:uncharacterized protein G2W53_026871 [Senna tora]|uniref:Uncharacterized protein n=1 Tax=Senna tora TaxID=362788 RepID=A0A834THU9_9FABA|nr:uncharacterized protein G2W53_026871 [Senna tora]